jgi:hypothetical protein
MTWQESLHNTMCRKQKRKIYIWFYEEATRNNNLETINKYCKHIFNLNFYNMNVLTLKCQKIFKTLKNIQVKVLLMNN